MAIENAEIRKGDTVAVWAAILLPERDFPGVFNSIAGLLLGHRGAFVLATAPQMLSSGFKLAGKFQVDIIGASTDIIVSNNVDAEVIFIFI